MGTTAWRLSAIVLVWGGEHHLDHRGLLMPVTLPRRAARNIGAAGLTLVDSAVAGLAGTPGLDVARAVGAGRDAIAPHVVGSPHLSDGRFGNLDPASPPMEGGASIMKDMVRRPGAPSHPIRVLDPGFDRPEADDDRAALAATWLGHATMLVDLDGVRVLTDPVLSRRCSPSQTVGPARMHAAPASADRLPTVDVVLISHDHYDHLDFETVTALAAAQPDALFICPIGVGARLEMWGIAPGRVREADWDQEIAVDVRGTHLRFVCCPARHFSGRFFYRDVTQWASWVVIGPEHRMFFSGDTGYSERYEDTGSRHGPFDLTLIAIGAYDPAWRDIHLDPEEAMAVHRMLCGSSASSDSVMIPIHWATFNLARHSWADPVARVLAAAQREASTVLVPPPGGRIDIDSRTGSGLADPSWWERSA